MNAKLVDEIPLWHFDEDLAVYKDGSLGAGIKLEGMDISCLSDESVNEFNRQLENMLLSLDEGTKLQIFYKINSNYDDLLDMHCDSLNRETPDYQKIKNAKVKQLRDGIRTELHSKVDIHFFVRSKPCSYKKQSFWQKPEEYSNVSLEEYKVFREKFLRTMKQVHSHLEQSGMEISKISPQGWLSLLFSYLNPDRQEGNFDVCYEQTSCQDYLTPSIASKLCLSDIHCSNGEIKIGKKYFRVVTLRNLPEGQTHAAMASQFQSLPFHFLISQNIHILDQAKEGSKLSLMRRVTHSMAAGSTTISDIESEAKLEKIEDLMGELMEGSTKLVNLDLNLIVWDEDLNNLDEKCDEILKAFRQMNQSEGLIETLPTKRAFFKNMPGNCEGFRLKKIKSSNAAHLMPVYAPWAGNKKPVCIFPTKQGSLFSLDVFNKELPNWNGVVFGGSGSGKSFSVCQLMLQFYGQDPKPKIIWIDNGASSKTMVNALGGEFLDFNLNSGLVLNMFDLPQGQSSAGPEKIKLILAILELILKEPEQSALKKFEKAKLEEAIYTLYRESHGIPVLSDLRNLLKKNQFKDISYFSEILYSWTGNTAYGRLLDGKSNVELAKDLITIEVQSLNSHSDFKNVILLLLTSHIQDCASADFARPYLCIVDEAERLFQTELAKQFIVTCYRTWRKFNSGIWALSQNYKDFMQDKNLKDSLLPNTSSLVILRQRKIDWKDFQETFAFNDAQTEAIQSLQIKKGEFSDFFYQQDERQIVLRLIPDRLSYWLCTSDANDKSKINTQLEMHPDKKLLEVLEDLANQ